MLPESAKNLVTSGRVAHVTTLNEDGSVHVSVAWVGLDGDDIVFGTLFDQRKLRNLRRDPRITISILTDVRNEHGLDQYLVAYGTAEVVEGGGAALLQRLAHVYLGEGVLFPPMPNPPDGFVTRVRVRRCAGIGPWAAREG